MRAGEIAVPYPLIDADAPALEAARLLAQEEIDVVLVRDERKGEVVALHDLGMLRWLVPDYAVQDRALARVIGAGDPAQLMEHLDGRTVADLLARERGVLPTVPADAHLVEVAAEMVKTGAALVAVVKDERIIGGVTSSAVLTALLGER